MISIYYWRYVFFAVVAVKLLDMGSRCSILNDTEDDVWITHGVNWEAIRLTARYMFRFLQAGASAAEYLGESESDEGEGVLQVAEAGIAAATKVASLAAKWRKRKEPTETTASALEEVSKEKAEDIQRKARLFKEKAKRVKPGEKYTWSGSLSLHMKVYVMNDKLQCDERACFTGPTDGSENVYPISEYFKNLDVMRDAIE